MLVRGSPWLLAVLLTRMACASAFDAPSSTAAIERVSA